MQAPAYQWQSPDGRVVEAHISDLARSEGLSFQCLKRCAAGRQDFHRGWRCLNPRRRLHHSWQAGTVGVHRWYHPDEGVVTATIPQLEAISGLRGPSLLMLATGRSESAGGWRYVEHLANWPLRQFRFLVDGRERSERLATMLAEGFPFHELNRIAVSPYPPPYEIRREEPDATVAA